MKLLHGFLGVLRARNSFLGLSSTCAGFRDNTPPSLNTTTSRRLGPVFSPIAKIDSLIPTASRTSQTYSTLHPV